MTRNVLVGLIIVVVGLLVLGIYSASRGSKQPTTTQNQNQAPTAEVYTVTIKDFAFSPSELTINKGEQVTFENQDPTTHTVTSDSGAFDSGQLATGQSFSFTFDTAGTFPYHCSIHPNMHGTIIVQ